MSLAYTRASRSKRRRNADRGFILFLAGFTVLLVGLVVLLNWLGNRPRLASASLNGVDLLPLAEPVSPLSGFHDMPRIPQGPVATRTVPTGAPQPNVDLPVLRWDWGAIPARPPVQQTFPVQNTGAEPLQITNLVTSCGCTTAELSSSLIPPGRRADLVVTFDPAFYETVGPVTRLVWLETNDPDMPLIELRLDANILP